MNRWMQVSRDTPHLRKSTRYTSGLRATDPYISDELHPYCSFVEGFTGGSGRLCNLGIPDSGPCSEARVGMPFGRWTSKGSRLVPLWKDDFRVVPGGLTLYHPRFVNKTAFVVFVVNTCDDCQDTKQAWQAYAIEGHELVGGNDSVNALLGTTITSRICTKKVQYLMFKRRDGLLVDYAGPFNAIRLRELLKKACLFQ